MTIEIPMGDYQYEQFASFCEHYNCKLLKPKRRDAFFKIESEDPVNFFWLGCNLMSKYDNGIAISTSSAIFGKKG